MTPRQALRQLCQQAGTPLEPPAPNQLYVRVVQDSALQTLSHTLHERDFYLVTLVATDERRLADNCFKLTYLFSHPTQDQFVFVENPIQGQPENTYISLYSDFKALDPFERKLADLMGLYPRQERETARVRPGSWLHECYPPHLYPLRRDQTAHKVQQALQDHPPQEQAPPPPPPDGEWLLPVGPIHAGVIEPGRFLFRLAGEVVEELDIRLGYTHKGIERLFQTRHTLADGWRLAEHVCGDSAFAHALAYCQAAEALAGAHPPRQAQLLRGLFLELERIANHVGDCGALAHDVAYDAAASELAALREQFLRLNQKLSGHRLLRGLNRPGGLILPGPLDVATARRTVSDLAAQFAEGARGLAQHPAFRDRLQWTGILTRQQALELGTTGLVARASGVWRDFRLQHPTGVYRDPAVHQRIQQALPPDDDSIPARQATAGDALARFLIRMHEVDAAAKVIAYILQQPELNTEQTHFVTPIEFRQAPNLEFGLGYVQGWRGDVVYWLMKDKFERIFRCQARDPSMLNWPALKAAVEPHLLEEDYVKRHKPFQRHSDSIVPDFPVINKSFNLSYAGNDL
jgi:Ni,Fe-hydrogenase III large subunit/Ni,Fe-hydrogenase III component G